MDKEFSFDVTKLKVTEQQAYNAMNDREKIAYVNKWMKIQMLQAELQDKIEKTNHRQRLRDNRERDKQRAKDTHRKIVNGGILSVYLPEKLKELDVEDVNKNTQLKLFLDFVFSLKEVKEYISNLSSDDTEEDAKIQPNFF